MVSLGCTTDNEKSGVSFILGRFIGLIIIGVVIALIGAFVQIPPTYFIAIFGLLTILFGVTILLKVFEEEFKMLKEKIFAMFTLANRFIPQRLLVPLQSARSKFQSMNGNTHGHRHRNGQCRKRQRFKTKHVFALGLSRGATPCVKVMVLAPLLIVANFWLALLIVIVYAATSTIYPIIGFLFGSLLRKSERYHKHLKVVGALILIVIGIYSILNGFILAEHTRGL